MDAEAWTTPRYAVLAYQAAQETARLAREAAEAERRAAALSAEVDRAIAAQPAQEEEPDVPFLDGHDNRNEWDQDGSDR